MLLQKVKSCEKYQLYSVEPWSISCPPSTHSHIMAISMWSIITITVRISAVCLPKPPFQMQYICYCSIIPSAASGSTQVPLHRFQDVHVANEATHTWTLDFCPSPKGNLAFGSKMEQTKRAWFRLHTYRQPLLLLCSMSVAPTVAWHDGVIQM